MRGQDEAEKLKAGFKVLGLEPDGRRPWMQRAVELRKGFRNFYGEGKI